MSTTHISIQRITADRRLAVLVAKRTTCVSMTMEEAFKQDLEGSEPSSGDLVDGNHEKHEEIAVEDNNSQDEPKLVVDKEQEGAVENPESTLPLEQSASVPPESEEVSHDDTNLFGDSSKPDQDSKVTTDEQAVASSGNTDTVDRDSQDRMHEIGAQELNSNAQTQPTETIAPSPKQEETEAEEERGEEEEAQKEEDNKEKPKSESEADDAKEDDKISESNEQPQMSTSNEELKDETYTESSSEPGVRDAVKIATKRPVESTVQSQTEKADDLSADQVQENQENAALSSEQPHFKTESSHGLQEDKATETSAETTITKQADLATPQSHDIVIPSYARWFHLQKIHSIEKQSLPEYFTNRIPSKTPQVYVKYRNFMVNSYRLNPNEFFTMTAARRSLCGDAGAILRIHKFLTKWGLINYQVDAKTKPKQVEPPFTGDFTTKHDAPRGLFPFESYKPAIQIPDLSRLKKLMHQIDPSPGVSPSEETKPSEPNLQIKEDKKRTLEDSSESSSPKAKLQRPNILDTVDKDWSRENLQKLLQGVQKYKSDWQRVAHFVGNKTAEQCILRFLQLPIEDPFLQSNIGDDLGPLKYAPHLPFSKADNPVMSTIAFLVGLVDPDLVKKMTDRAIDSMNQENEKKISSENSSYIKEGSELALATLGARSHVFATNEERHMNALANEMTQLQVKKVGLKLKLLATMEKSFEMEKKAIQKQQEDTFIQRLSLAKHSNAINAKLQQCLDDFDDKAKLQAHFNDLKELQEEPARTSMGKGMSSTPVPDGTLHNQGRKSVDDLTKDPFVKPVSVDAPQAYRYWSG
ncbi:LAFA_0G04038g1_1 [Lachancea sp. 'fantastica']|nr:LAFA_0G04038g1_1 [Lachancea sp. 'fantastica']